jgi:hypothetical protein
MLPPPPSLPPTRHDPREGKAQPEAHFITSSTLLVHQPPFALLCLLLGGGMDSREMRSHFGNGTISSQASQRYHQDYHPQFPHRDAQPSDELERELKVAEEGASIPFSSPSLSSLSISLFIDQITSA